MCLLTPEWPDPSKALLVAHQDSLSLTLKTPPGGTGHKSKGYPSCWVRRSPVIRRVVLIPLHRYGMVFWNGCLWAWSWLHELQSPKWGLGFRLQCVEAQLNILLKHTFCGSDRTGLERARGEVAGQLGRSWSSPSTIWGSEIKLRLTGLVAGTSTCWVISPAPLPSYYMYYFISSSFTSDRRTCGPLLHRSSSLTLSYTKAHHSVRPH